MKDIEGVVFAGLVAAVQVDVLGPSRMSRAELVRRKSG